MSMFTLAISFDHFQFALIHGPDIPGYYVILLFTALGLAYITSPIHNCVLFLLWLHPFILSGVISPLISSSILGTYRPGEFLFQHIYTHKHTMHSIPTAHSQAQYTDTDSHTQAQSPRPWTYCLAVHGAGRMPLSCVSWSHVLS